MFQYQKEHQSASFGVRIIELLCPRNGSYLFQWNECKRNVMIRGEKIERKWKKTYKAKKKKREKRKKENK